MQKLPETVDFDEARFPGLQHIFRDLDNAIAAMIASDPSFRAKRTISRRGRTASAFPGAKARSRSNKRVAA